MNIKNINIMNESLEKVKITKTSIYFNVDDNKINDTFEKTKNFGEIKCLKSIDKKKEQEMSIKNLKEKETILKEKLKNKSLEKSKTKEKLQIEEKEYLTIKKELEKIKNIYLKLLNKLGNIDNIIDFLDSLNEKDKMYFMEELMKKCQFTKEEYYSNDDNQKIFLLCELNEKGKLEIINENNYYWDIKKTLKQIRKDLLDGEILIKQLDEFLRNEESQAIKKLRLLKIILKDFDPEEAYKDLKNTFEKLLNKNQIKLINIILEEINFSVHIEKRQKQINYSLKDLLIYYGK